MDRSLLRETECYLVNLGTAATANGRGSALFRGGIRRTLGYYPGIARVFSGGFRGFAQEFDRM